MSTLALLQGQALLLDETQN